MGKVLGAAIVAASWGVLVAWSGSRLASRIDAVLDRGLIAGLLAAVPAVRSSPRSHDPRRAGRDGVVALTAPLAMLLLIAAAGGTPDCARSLAVFGGAWIAARVDAETGIVPDVVTLPLLLGGFASAPAWPPAAGGAIVGWATGTAVRVAGRRLGMGDVKLLAAIGAWIGPQATAALFPVAALLMLPVFLLSGRIRAPFAPAIAMALLLILVHAAATGGS